MPNIHHRHPLRLCHHKNAGRTPDTQPIPHRAIRLHLSRTGPIGVHHKRHRLSMRLEPPARKARQVVLAPNRPLIRKHIPAKRIRHFRRHLVLQVPSRHRRIEAPQMDLRQRIVMPHQRNLVLPRRRAHHRKSLRARGTLQVFKFVNRHLRPRRWLQHRRVLERNPHIRLAPIPLTLRLTLSRRLLRNRHARRIATGRTTITRRTIRRPELVTGNRRDHHNPRHRKQNLPHRHHLSQS